MMERLPVAAASGSLPWRSASSHWYKAMDEPHAGKHGAKNPKIKQKNRAMLKQIHTDKQINKCMRMSRAYKWHIQYQNHNREWHLRCNTHGENICCYCVGVLKWHLLYYTLLLCYFL